MKQKIKPGIVVLALSLMSVCSFSQDTQQTTTPPWVSDRGYWVLEGNIHSPRNHVVLFYTNDNVLIYKETLTGVRINVKRTKVKMKLKKALESAILVWEKNKVPEENKEYVSSALR